MYLASRPPFRRIVAIDASIRSGRYPNSVSIATSLEVSARTVHRDIEFMRDSLGAPLEFCRRRNGYYYRNGSWQLPAVQLTEGELVALFIAEQALRQYRGTPFEPDLVRAFAKLTASLPDSISIDLGALARTHSFRTSTVSLGDLEMFAKLAGAVLGRRQLKITYWTASRDSVTERVIDPYHMANVDGEWYLIGHCHLREDVRMFSPWRVRRVEETGRSFEPPVDFSIARYLDGAFRVVRAGDGQRKAVTLRFDRSAARYVREKVWHTSQRIRERGDGSLEMDLEVDSWVELRRWVLSFGSGCEVVGPAELRVEMAEEIGRMALRYGPRGDSDRVGSTGRSRRRRRISSPPSKGGARGGMA